MRIGLVQYSPAWEDRNENIQRLTAMVNKHHPLPDLLIFPEMTLTGFSMAPDTLAEDLNGESARFFSGMAQNHSVHIVAGLISRRDGAYFNTLLHFDRTGRLKVNYDKIHPFSFTGEHLKYTAGTQPAITEIEGFRFGLSICYDLRFPELFRQYAKHRVHAIVNIANWPDLRIEHFKLLARARAVENQCFMLACNRSGGDPKNQYPGNSMIVSPAGEVLAEANDSETVVIRQIDLREALEQQSRFPFIDDIILI